MQITKATEKNKKKIKNAHDSKIKKIPKWFKDIEKIIKQNTWKNIKADVRKYVKNYPIYMIRKHDRFRKKIYISIFVTTKNIFPKNCFVFCYWITGIIESNNKNVL